VVLESRPYLNVVEKKGGGLLGWGRGGEGGKGVVSIVWARETTE